MATSAYQLWLKKREFKTSRTPPILSSKSATPTSLSAPNKLSPIAISSSKTLDGRPQGNSFKLHAVSGVETTKVAVKSVIRPAAVKKRPRSWLSSRKEAVDGAERPPDAKVAGLSYVAGIRKIEFDGRKRPRSTKKDTMKVTTLKLGSAAKGVIQSSTTKVVERTGRGATKVAAGDESDAKTAARLTNSSVVLNQMEKRKVGDEIDQSTIKRLRFDTDAKAGGVNRFRQLKGLEKEVMERKRSIFESDSADSTTKRLRFDADVEESDSAGEPIGLPPKIPMKQKMTTVMLDESQYWLAVDRFSHLT